MKFLFVAKLRPKKICPQQKNDSMSLLPTAKLNIWRADNGSTDNLSDCPKENSDENLIIEALTIDTRMVNRYITRGSQLQ